jgi:cation/acetate symporter
LLLTIGNAFIHDMRAGQSRDPAAKQQSQEERVILSKFALLAVAMVAALVASWKPAEILALVSASFSLAASAFFPGMVMGIFWDKASRRGAIWGMLLGLGATILYMTLNAPIFKATFSGLYPDALVFGIQPISAGILGVPIGFLTLWLCSLIWPDQPDPGRSPVMAPDNQYPGL